MSLYEIEIRRKDYREPVDMDAVYAALKENSVDFDPDERRNCIDGGEPDEHPEYVYVVSGEVGEAVGVINSLGYHTDEEDIEDFLGTEDDEDEEEYVDPYPAEEE